MGGVTLKVDDWYDFVLVGIVLIASILAIGHSAGVLIFQITRRGAKFKIAGMEVGGGSHMEAVVDENKFILKELQIDMALSFSMSLDMLRGLRALLEAAKGECNGNVDEALVAIKKKQKALDDALIKKMRP